MLVLGFLGLFEKSDCGYLCVELLDVDFKEFLVVDVFFYFLVFYGDLSL
jgi:hypothetical protein